MKSCIDLILFHSVCACCKKIKKLMKRRNYSVSSEPKRRANVVCSVDKDFLNAERMAAERHLRDMIRDSTALVGFGKIVPVLLRPIAPLVCVNSVATATATVNLTGLVFHHPTGKFVCVQNGNNPHVVAHDQQEHQKKTTGSSAQRATESWSGFPLNGAYLRSQAADLGMLSVPRGRDRRNITNQNFRHDLLRFHHEKSSSDTKLNPLPNRPVMVTVSHKILHGQQMSFKIMGAKSTEEMDQCLRRTKMLLDSCSRSTLLNVTPGQSLPRFDTLDVTMDRAKTHMLVATFNVSFALPLELLDSRLQPLSSYNPSRFPALVIKTPFNVTVLVSTTGSVVMTGARTELDLAQSRNFIIPILQSVCFHTSLLARRFSKQ
jgi:hypothetical protein